MKRDIIVAVIIGFFIGAVVAIMIVNLPAFLKKGPSITRPLEPSESTGSSEPIPLGSNVLEIKEPQDGTISQDAQVNLTGKTQKGRLMIIETENEQFSLAAEEDGTFTQKIELHEGGNSITVSSYDEKGNLDTKTITVFYTEEKL